MEIRLPQLLVNKSLEEVGRYHVQRCTVVAMDMGHVADLWNLNIEPFARALSYSLVPPIVDSTRSNGRSGSHAKETRTKLLRRKAPPRSAKPVHARRSQFQRNINTTLAGRD